MPLVFQPVKKPLPLAPKGLEFLQHQKEAIKFAIEHWPCYLALDPGLGKTIVAATVSRFFNGFTVFITPPSLVENVAEEFRRWFPESRVMQYGGRKADYTRCNVLIVPDSILGPTVYYFLAGLLLHFRKDELDAILIIDEAHRFSNPGTIRTAALLGDSTMPGGVVGLFDRTIYMSGTPLSNRPMELYPILSRSAPEAISNMNRWDFGKRYCDGKRVQIGWGRTPKFAWDFKGQSNLSELARRILYPHGRFMLRLRKDRLKLPPKLEEVFVFSRSMSPRLASLEKGIGEAYEDIEDLIKAEIGGKAGLKSRDVHIATYRRLLGMEKVKAAAEYVNALLAETSESILIFGQHKDVVMALSVQLSEWLPIVISGDTDQKKRQSLVKEFQAGKSRVLIGNYQAMGIGFTLTRASRVLFVEFSWNPAVNDQAADRAHRIGQTKAVYAQYMVYKDSVDKKVIEALLKKREGSRHI